MSHSTHWALVASRDIQRAANTLRVPMTHVARDAEYLPVLAHRIESELRALRNRERALVALAADVASLLPRNEV